MHYHLQVDKNNHVSTKKEINMDIRKFFSLGIKRDKKAIQIEKINKKKLPEVGEMAAGNLTAATNAMTQLIEEQQLSIKILAVQDGTYSPVLVDYAVKMAHRLDCEIIALDVSDEPLAYDGERRRRESTRFFQRAQRSAEAVLLKAEVMSVKCRHIVEIANPEDTIKALSQEDKSIRYVLTKPIQEQLGADQRQVRVPVFDLNCSRL